MFRRAGSREPLRGGVAIGDSILDLGGAAERGCIRRSRTRARRRSAVSPLLNALMAAGPAALGALRLALSRALRADSPLRASLQSCTGTAGAAATLSLPAHIGDYTDFYSSIHHATAVGRLFRPDQPLMPNYRWLPVAYHGRSSSMAVSPQSFPRPMGQRLPPGAEQPLFDRSQRLDYELELGVFIGRGNELGTRIDIDEAESHIFGLCLLNDWSARDLQAWEYQPLGPFLGKNFATTLSPWIVTLEALEPYRVPWRRGGGRPAAAGLSAQRRRLRAAGAFDIQLEVLIETDAMRSAGQPPHAAVVEQFPPRLLDARAHDCASHRQRLQPAQRRSARHRHAIGARSRPRPARCWSCQPAASIRSSCPMASSGGSSRTVTASSCAACCERPGAARIGFGEVRGTVQPAHP